MTVFSFDTDYEKCINFKNLDKTNINVQNGCVGFHSTIAYCQII